MAGPADGTARLSAARARKLPFVDPYKRRSRFYFALARISATKFGAWFSTNVAWKLDPFLLKLSGGRLSTAGPLAVGLLESRGARTGLPRHNATLYFNDGERVTIIASKRGLPENPAWYYNVRAHPDVVYGGLPLRAELVEDKTERQRLWELADRVFPSTPTTASAPGVLGGSSRSCSCCLAEPDRRQLKGRRCARALPRSIAPCFRSTSATKARSARLGPSRASGACRSARRRRPCGSRTLLWGLGQHRRHRRAARER